MRRILKALSFLALLFVGAGALYADQAGKWDWRHQFVGTVDNALFDASGVKVFISTSDAVVATLDARTGDIVWRQVLDILGDQHAAPAIHYSSKAGLLYSLDADGRFLRAWIAETGIVKFETMLSDERCDTASRTSLFQAPADDRIVAFYGNGRVASVNMRNGEIVWTAKAETPYTIAALHEDTLLLAKISGEEVQRATLSAISGGTVQVQTAYTAAWIDESNCDVISTHVWCIGSTTHVVDLMRDREIDIGIESTKVTQLNDAHVGIIARDNIMHVCSNSVEFEPKEVYKVADTINAAGDADDSGYFTTIDSECTVHQWTRSDGQMKEQKKITIATAKMHVCPARRAFTKKTAHGKGAQTLIVGADASLTMISDNILWHRHEALAHIATAEMLDLPLTESQANIEIEFVDDEKSTNIFGSIVAHFIRRVRTQAQQLRVALLKAVQQTLKIAESAHLVTGSMETLIHSTEDDENEPFERDFFGLHKMIVAVSRDGVLYGLDNRNGKVLWHKWLESALTNARLYVLRTTALHPHPALCALVYDANHMSHLIVFDPITGEIVERRMIDTPIIHATALPYVTDESASALLTITKDLRAQIYPSYQQLYPTTSPPQSIHVMLPELASEEKTFVGYEVHISREALDGETMNVATLRQTWRTILGFPSSARVTVVPKRSEERVHTLGRVLGDRSVLYKYVNPHLVALLIENGNNLAVLLIDAVSGSVLHQERHAHTTLPPTLADGPSRGVVHCENWLVYTLWNDRARRCELAVLEFYEGGYQTDSERFSSRAPTLSKPFVARQAYIFAQSPTAMGVSNTERGLTNRVVLLALPMGGLLEMPKALLDARRPIQVLPEHREEGIIPYAPELPLSTEHIVNYNRSLTRVHFVRAWPSGLESTSLTLAAGLDLFSTRLTPSGNFDILKDDFDHWFISLVLIALIFGSLVSKRLAKNRDLKQAWK